MRVLICDDDFYIVEILSAMTEEYFKKHGISVEITSKTSGSDIIKADNSYDIAFLDVEMPEYSGLAVAKHLKKKNSDIILFMITSFPEYLDEAMDLNVLRYLPKPPDKERVFSGLDSAMKRYSENTRMILSDGTSTSRVYVKEILYVTIHRRKSMIVTKDDEIISNRTLSEWKEILGDMSFGQPHYSYIVNLQNIEKIENDIIILRKNNGEKVTVKISQRKSKEFKKKFFDCLIN